MEIAVTLLVVDAVVVLLIVLVQYQPLLAEALTNKLPQVALARMEHMVQLILVEAGAAALGLTLMAVLLVEMAEAVSF